MNATQWTKCRETQKTQKRPKWEKGEFKEWIRGSKHADFIAAEKRFVDKFDIDRKTLLRWYEDETKIKPICWYFMQKDKENARLKKGLRK